MSDAILAQLNDPQRQAVSAPLGNLLVLAGAGSGKTRVLVLRIAWLLQRAQFSPFSILAVTFTNKAANEMRGRVEAILQHPAKGMWLGTFHGIALRLLRAHWKEARLPENFQILDSDDQLRLVKRTLRALNIDEDKWSPRKVQGFINGQKDQGNRPRHINPQGDPYLKTMQQMYEAYEQACQRGGLVDFTELLLRAHELWQNNPALLRHYQQRFRYVLVDEFQDTNTIQYAWIKSLISDGDNFIMAVGDDDQSIYGWRGACVDNIHRFSKDFAAGTIRLEQNYRSTATILQAANQLISHNKSRLGKNLWTDGSSGEMISIYAGFNEVDEARFIAGRIAAWHEAGNCYREAAVLYRSNAQSRALEEALLQAGIPYRVYGGMRFFERAEIKDALSYLRLFANRHDDAAFERVVNTPTRGIGQRTVEGLRTVAKEQDVSLWQAGQLILAQGELAARAANALRAFVDLIEETAFAGERLALAEKIELVTERSGLPAYYQSQDTQERAQARIENLQELITAAEQFSLDTSAEPAAQTNEFLAHAALEAGESQGDANQDCAQLMTLHSAKGLEFPLVFMAGLEEGLFPHVLSADNPDRLEEERRLCYVGMTRAMQKLYISYAELRRAYGKEHYNSPSRFLREIPSENLEEVRTGTSANRTSAPPVARVGASKPFSDPDASFNLGQAVWHKKFGEGIVLALEGSGQHARVQVRFTREGSKWLVLAYANLQTSPVVS